MAAHTHGERTSKRDRTFGPAAKCSHADEGMPDEMESQPGSLDELDRASVRPAAEKVATW